MLYMNLFRFCTATRSFQSFLLINFNKKMKKLLPFILLFVFCGVFFGQWTIGADMPEGIRAGNTISYTDPNDNAYMYIIGGRNDQGIISNKTYRYNIKTNVWDAKQNVPTPILGAASARIGDNIFIIGGMVTTPGTVTRKVYKYNIENDLWNNAADFPRSFTDGDAVPYQDSLIYVVGSYNSEKTFVYNINKNKWRECNPVPSPGASLSYGAVSISGNKLVYVGGSNGTFSTTYWNNVWIGEINQNNRSVINWTQGTSFPGQTRTFFELQPWNNGLILIGGTTDNTFDTYTNENYFFDVENNTWSQLTNKPTAWNTGNAASVFLDGNWKLICSGGFEQQYLKKTEIYNQENLSVSDNSETCQLKNMKTISGNRPGINFCLSENGKTYLTIWDMQGRKMKKEKKIADKKGMHFVSLANEGFKSGLYIINLKQNQNSVSRKIQIRN